MPAHLQLRRRRAAKKIRLSPPVTAGSQQRRHFLLASNKKVRDVRLPPSCFIADDTVGVTRTGRTNAGIEQCEIYVEEGEIQACAPRPTSPEQHHPPNASSAKGSGAAA
jgi:hypothetical protein